MSPEQAAGEDVDARSDLWSLGVVTYEMLARRRPFEGTNALAVINAVQTTTPAPVRSLRPDVSRQLEEIVNRTMVRHRDRRTITAAEVRDLASACYAQLSSGALPPVERSRTSRRVQLAAAAVALAVVAGGIAWWAQRNAKVRWARQEALPEIIRLADADKFDAAYTLAQQAKPYIPDDPLLAEQIRGSNGARSSIPNRPAPTSSTARTAEAMSRGGPSGRRRSPTPACRAGCTTGKASCRATRSRRTSGLARSRRRRTSALRSSHRTRSQPAWSESHRPIRRSRSPCPLLNIFRQVQLPDYWIDRHEVTNRAFKRFVDDGGYRRAELWREPFLKDGRTLTFDEAMKYFRDATGQPGPAEWELGTYAAGHDEYPVGGVSWYEAAAYARWAGKSLPTIYHWTRAAGLGLSGDVVPASNFNGKSPIPVGTSGAITQGGTTDMGGNVKEWVLNAAGAKRYILGGAWNDPVYMFTDADAQAPFTRHPTYGFRCIRLDRPGTCRRT